MEKELSERKKNPTERDQEIMNEKAMAMHQDLEAEVCRETPDGQACGLLGSFSFSSGSGSGSGHTSGKPKATAKGKASAKSKARSDSGSAVLVEATKFRGRSVRAFKDAQSQLERAYSIGTKTLEEATKDSAGSSSSMAVSLIRSRLQLVTLALGSQEALSADEAPAPAHEGDINTKTDLKLWQEVQKDPYLKDLQSTILSQSSCRSYPSLAFERNVSLHLHSSISSLNNAINAHQHNIEVLKKIAECMSTAANDWRTSTQALRKACV